MQLFALFAIVLQPKCNRLNNLFNIDYEYFGNYGGYSRLFIFEKIAFQPSSVNKRNRKILSFFFSVIYLSLSSSAAELKFTRISFDIHKDTLRYSKLAHLFALFVLKYPINVNVIKTANLSVTIDLNGICFICISFLST